MSESRFDEDAELVVGELMLPLQPAPGLAVELPELLHAELTRLLERADDYSRAAQSVNHDTCLSQRLASV